ncbi:K+-transporting ATPase KdpF subunit [Psychromicrobium silvestre]|uniref:K+-transporting ATPase KdpF subunit n=1 Tax=Psychromicrobium silvestre TaxID=1645614 RepID=A0A7Y9LTK8_9MICC|nr:K(+)-transporting ATPase subunit F [Psychromicrobium silvestre]NYE95366.1 K+-transporting ATPase KdpF subunit [Psychromicrobium silvestre]
MLAILAWIALAVIGLALCGYLFAALIRPEKW